MSAAPARQYVPPEDSEVTFIRQWFAELEPSERLRLYNFFIEEYKRQQEKAGA